MIRIAFSVFIVLHGLVHLLYLGQSTRMFELQPGMVWPDGSWAFSKLMGDGATRNLASIFLILGALGFLAGGAGLITKQDWGRLVVVAAAIFSTVIYLLLWNGRLANLANNGWVGVFINLLIVAVILLFKWPKF